MADKPQIPKELQSLVMAVFAEIGAMVFLVVRYLFTPSGDRILDLIDRRNASRE